MAGESVNVQVGVQVTEYELVMRQVQQIQDKLNALSDHTYQIDIKLDNSIGQWAKTIRQSVQSVDKTLGSLSNGGLENINTSLGQIQTNTKNMTSYMEIFLASFATQAVKLSNSLKDIFDAIPEGQDLSAKSINKIGESIGGLMSQVENLGSAVESLKSSLGKGNGNADSKSLVDSLIDEEGVAKLQAYVSEITNLYSQLYQEVGTRFSGYASGNGDSDIASVIRTFIRYGGEYKTLVGELVNFNANAQIPLPRLSGDPNELMSMANKYMKAIDMIRSMQVTSGQNAGTFLVDQSAVEQSLASIAQAKKEYTDYVKSIKDGQKELSSGDATTSGVASTSQNVVLDAQKLLDGVNTQLNEIRAKLQETFDFSTLNIDATPVTSVLDGMKKTVDEIGKTLADLAPALSEAKKAAADIAASANSETGAAADSLSPLFDYNVGISDQTNKLNMEINATKDALESLKTGLSTQNFSSDAIANITKDFENLNMAVKSYKVESSGDKLKLTINGTDKLGATTTKMMEFNSATGELIRSTESLTRKLELSDNSIDSVTTKIAKRVEAVQNGFANDAFSTTINGLQRRFESLGDSGHDSMSKIQNDLEHLKELESSMQTETDPNKIGDLYDDWSTTLDRVKNNLKDVEQAEKQVKKEAEDTSKAQGRMFDAQKFGNQVQTWMQTNSQYAGQYAARLNEIVQEYEKAAKVGDTAKMSALKKEFDAIKSSCTDATQSAKTFGSVIKEALGGTMLGSIAKAGIAFAIRELRMVGKEMVKSAVEIESSLAQLQVITGASESQLNTFFAEGATAAREYGTEVASMLDSVTTFSRLGYNLQDSLDFSRVATELSNVADVAVDAGTSGLTSILKAYQDESVTADHIADVLTVVGQKYAISASELLTAFERGGAALSATGTSFEKSAALFAAANAALQNPEGVGTAMKTVSARIRGAKSELEELGEEYEDVAEGFSKYRDELKALTNIDNSGGVDIMLDEATNSYKDIYEIFVEISGVWDKLSDTTQARVAEILGGTRQLSVIASLITNIKDAEGAYEDAMNSAGVAAEANNIVMDTTEKKVEQLKTSFQVLSRDVLSSDLTKGIVDFGTKATEVVDNLVNKFGSLPVALGALTGLDLIKNLGKIYCPPREQFLAA